MTSLEDERWDPTSPGFRIAILRMMIVLGVLETVIGSLLLPFGFWGFISGGALAIVLFLIAIQTGKVFERTRSYARVMLWLLLSQFVLWVGMAILLAVIQVNPVGFVIGVSILPVSIVLTLAWYAVRRRWLPS